MAMSQALSEEEFHRMQTQLLELRTQNYQLSDELRKNSTELNAVRQKNVVLERDFIKAQKALNKSKKAQEVEALLSENEMLQGKLHSQEEDFRLQNSTLMTELSKLCTQIEQLEQENKGLKEGGASSGPPSNPASSPVDGELLRLRAENATLQKKMKVDMPAVISTYCSVFLTFSFSSVSSFSLPLVLVFYSWFFVPCFLPPPPCGLSVLQAANQSAVSQEQVDNILQENDALRTNLAALEQIQTVKTQEVNLLREQQEALTQELHQRRAEREVMSAQRDDLESQLQESSFASRKLLEQLTEEGQEKEKLLRDLEEAKKVHTHTCGTAEKRKAMLDEMAIQMNQEKFDHKEAESELKLQHEKEVLGVRARYEKELRGLHEDKNRSEKEIPSAARAKELESLQPRVEELQTQVQSMEGTRGWFERRLKEAEVNLRSAPPRVSFLQEKQSEMEEVKQQLAEAEKQKDGHKDTIEKLKQEIKDTVDGQRILEKKGSAALKDLKRQLQLERKRADKLQERLQEILTNSKSRTGLEELVLSEINSPSRTQQTGDSSSVSSFSYRDMIKEAQPTNQNKSGGGSPQSQRPAELSDDEVGELFQRLAEVQQEKWMLEEKVKHLEVSCSSMAEDICRKSSIIETYVMESRIDVSGGGERGSLGSVLRDLVKPGDENLREMNKKLQNMLEEQLTKNMHLQKDLEVLSQELVRLSKDSGAAGSG
uniref:GRIP1 associated protein 1 n=1 Tax=Gasterosteus aculeatus aculeatus TaxID=481459 RepID=A0AAQ4PD46_GASAC